MSKKKPKGVNEKLIWIPSYIRKDGTKVRGHIKTSPDKSKDNNLSSLKK